MKLDCSPCSFCYPLMLVNLYFYFPGKTLIWGLGWWLTTMALALEKCESKKNKILFSREIMFFPRRLTVIFIFLAVCLRSPLACGCRRYFVAQLLLQFFLVLSSVELTYMSSAFPFNQMNPNTDFHCLKTFGSHFTEDIAIPTVRSNPSFDVL